MHSVSGKASDGAAEGIFFSKKCTKETVYIVELVGVFFLNGKALNMKNLLLNMENILY